MNELASDSNAPQPLIEETDGISAAGGQPDPAAKEGTDSDADVSASAEAVLQESFDEESFANGEAARPGESHEANLETVLNIPVVLSMELGRTRINIRDLLKLGEGSVVQLDRSAGDPLDILVNDCLVARGEVVVVHERFGIRVTDILSPDERVRRIR